MPAILHLARRALGWTDGDDRFIDWKHFQNPFGASPMWLADVDGAVVGFRAFLRWELATPDGRVLRAVRAVDTATDPEFQGRGIFTRLTLAAVEEMRDEGVDLVFNTPNDKSGPGYLKMGWSTVGQLPTEVRPNRWRFPLAVLGARRPADREPAPTTIGEPATVLSDRTAELERLLESLPVAPGLATNRTAAYLAWRYAASDLGYRVVHTGAWDDGVALFRLRRRGAAVEAVVNDLLVPEGGDAGPLLRGIGNAGADYLLRLASTRDLRRWDQRFVRLPRTGPTLVCRPLSTSSVPPLASWALTMGDIELL